MKTISISDKEKDKLLYETADCKTKILGSELLCDLNDEDIFISNPLKSEWCWDVFGAGLLMVHPIGKVTLWRRILTTVILGSKWRKL